MKKKKIIIFIITFLLVIALGIGIWLFINKPIKKEKKHEEETFTYTPPLYKICDIDSCIYLLGSMHLGDDRIDNLSKETMDIYNSVDKLAVEMDVTDISINLFDFIAEDVTIEDIASEELIEKIKKFQETNSLFIYDALKYYKIGYISSYIESILYYDVDMVNQGVDSFLLEKAHEDNKEIISLETLDEQMELMVGFSDNFYLKEIENTIDNYEELKKELKILNEAYLSGNIDILKEIIYQEEELESEEDIDYVNKMYTERNNKMTERVKEFLDNNDNILVAVGAAHVIGNDGIIDQLEDNYSIEIIKNH